MSEREIEGMMISKRTYFRVCDLKTLFTEEGQDRNTKHGKPKEGQPSLELKNSWRSRRREAVSRDKSGGVGEEIRETDLLLEEVDQGME